MLKHISCMYLIIIILPMYTMEPSHQQPTAHDSLSCHYGLIEELSTRLEQVECRNLELAVLISLEQERHDESIMNLRTQLTIANQKYQVLNQGYLACKKHLENTLKLLHQLTVALDAHTTGCSAHETSACNNIIPRVTSSRKKIFVRNKQQQAPTGSDNLADSRDYRDAL